MIAQRLSIALLAVLAIVLGINMVSASSRLVTAHDTYDRIEMELTTFEYAGPESPITTTFVVRNPTGRTVEVIEIELALNAGIHRVGGGATRPLTELPPGEMMATPVELRVFDQDYLRRQEDGEIDWRLRGRIMVKIDPDIDPEWIPFTVRYIPE